MCRLVLLCLLVLASPAALAFPPCPIAPVVIQNADRTASSGGAEIGISPSPDPVPPQSEDGDRIENGGATRDSDVGHAQTVADPWMLIHAYTVGPEKLKPLLDSAPGKPGECNRVSSALPLAEAHASDGRILMAPRYAPSAVLGLLELPDYLAVAPRELRTVYSLSMSIDNAPLGAAGEWVDVAQIELADAQRSGRLHGILRLRKLRSEKGQRLQLILSTWETSAVDGRDSVVAEWQEPDHVGYSLKLTWHQQRTSAQQATHPASESVATKLQLHKGDGAPWVGLSLPDAFLHTLQFGVLDYNSAQDQALGAHLTLGRLSAVSE